MSDIVERLRDGKWNEEAISDDAAISRAYEITEEAADTIKALRAQLQTALDRETATTARYDARIADLEAKIAWDQAVDEVSYDGFLRAENARLREALQGFTHRQRELDRLAEGGFPDSYVVSVGCTLGDYRRAREALKETK